MTKTELLALAERLDEICGEHGDIDAVSLRSAAAILRKLAALEPAVFTSQAWMNEPNGFPRVVSHTKRAGFDKPLHDLTGIIDHE